MPPSPPTPGQPPKTSSGLYDTGSTTAQNVPGRGISFQPQHPTLPPVTALTNLVPSGAHPVSSTDAGSPVAVRTFGVHSILNPAADSDSLRPPARISQSPSRSASTTFGSYQPPLISPRVRKRKDDTSPTRASHAPAENHPGRRRLTPKSPALRSVSQGARGSPTGGSHPSLPQGSVEGRIYKAEPGESASGIIPPVPPLNLGHQGVISSVQAHEHISNAATVSYSNSTTSYSGNTGNYIGSPSSSSNLAEREAPSPFRPSMTEAGPSAVTGAQVMSGGNVHSRSATRTYGSGQPSFQMELSTDIGPIQIPVEIDTLQASKLADEKRRRNAGASARFRQRRKEKEQAASQHIADLQKQVRDVTEDRDFYITERNFLRDILNRTPGVTIPPRPPSPRLRRPPVSGHYSTASVETTPNVEYGRHDIGEPSPAQRRRTSEYQPSFAAASIPPASYPPQYAPSQSPAYALPPPSLPPAIQDQRAQPVAPGPTGAHPHPNHPPPPSLPPGPGLRPQSYDPFRRDMNPR